MIWPAARAAAIAMLSRGCMARILEEIRRITDASGFVRRRRSSNGVSINERGSSGAGYKALSFVNIDALRCTYALLAWALASLAVLHAVPARARAGTACSTASDASAQASKA